MGPVKPIASYIGNQYIIVTINYTTKWVETKAFRDNMAKNTTKFIYDPIITRFGYLIHLVSDQGSHFINKTIVILMEEFMISHHKSPTYSPQGNE